MNKAFKDKCTLSYKYDYSLKNTFTVKKNVFIYEIMKYDIQYYLLYLYKILLL